MIKKSSVIAVIAIPILLFAITILGRGILRQQQFDESSREFAISAALRILGGDIETQQINDEAEQMGSNPETLRGYAHPTLLAQDSLLSDYINSLYFATRFLGELEIVETISGGSDVPVLAFDEGIPSATYDLEVVYTGGDANIRIALIMHEDEWLISEFLVESNQLAD